MTDTTPRAGAPLLAAAQAQKHVTHNEALYQFDALLNARFADRDLSAAPESPADGDTYLVKAAATGAWAGQDGKIAYSADGGWRFYAPFAGLVAYVADENSLIVFDGESWRDYGGMVALQNLPSVGVNVMADETNKFSVKSNALLFAAQPSDDGGSGDVRLSLSKEDAGKTASLVFQDAFSGRAEIGLAGDDDFHIKVSPDGSSWAELLCLRAGSGAVSLPAGKLAFPPTASASPDANTLDDYAEGNFTPCITGTISAGSNAYSVQVGTYTKIGNRVLFEIYVRLSASSGMAGNLQVTGLPFTSNSLANNYSVCTTDFIGVTMPSPSYSQIVSSLAPGQTSLNLLVEGTGVRMALAVAQLASTGGFVISGSYRV
jgi:hypothetical protein